MALATGSVPRFPADPLPPDPLQLMRRLALQGGGFALCLLAAFSGSLYWGIAKFRAGPRMIDAPALQQQRPPWPCLPCQNGRAVALWHPPTGSASRVRRSGSAGPGA
jgi:hypothetical protein